MKQFKTLLFAAIIFVGATSFSIAQSKIAHIKSIEIMKLIPEDQIKKIDDELQKISATHQKTAKETENEIIKLQKQYAAEQNSKTEEENKKRAEELFGMENSLRQYVANAQRELQLKRELLMQPIQTKIQNAIEKVAKAQGFNYVLDVSQGSVLFTDGKDIFEDVKKELGY